jgi:hypothetical protein
MKNERMLTWQKQNKTSCEEFQTRGGTKLRFWIKLGA